MPTIQEHPLTALSGPAPVESEAEMAGPSTEPLSGGAPSEQRPLRFSLCLGSVLLLAWVSWACLFSHVEHELSRAQIHVGEEIAYAFLPARSGLLPGRFNVEVLEDGRAVGPRVASQSQVRVADTGAYAYRPRSWPRDAVVYFATSDGSDPSQNGRRYVVRYPRRQLLASVALLITAWLLLPAAVVRFWRVPEAPLLGGPGNLVGAAGWSLLVVAGLYTAFAVQAWLPPSNAPWFLAIGAIGLPWFLARRGTSSSSIPPWILWVGGLLVWGACTAVAESVYGSGTTLGALLLASAWGCVLYLGFRGTLDRPGARNLFLIKGLVVVVACVSLARSAGFDLLGPLASADLSRPWPPRVTNPWTTKFVAHWVLVVGWCGFLAMVRCRRVRPRDLAVLVALTGVTVGLSGSKAAIVALAVSAVVGAVAVRWGAWTRRALVGGLMLGVVAAPLFAGVPWRAHSALPGAWVEGPLASLELDARGSIWEYSRRMISMEPLSGWGIGATKALPGGDLSIAEVLGLESPAAESDYARRMAMRGGHPHNAALLIWLDLGLVGALLMAGLLWAVGRTIAGFESHGLTHAALLGLLSVTVIFLVFNYPLWEPEVVSILWMSVVLPAAALPRREVERQVLLRDGVIVGVLVLLACGLLAHERLSRWLPQRGLRGQEVVLAGEGGSLFVGGERRPLQFTERLEAGAELVGDGPSGRSFIRGWAYDPAGARSREAVLVFVGQKLVGLTWPERPSPEAFSRTEPKDVRALVSGFLVPVEPEKLDLEAPVTVVALGSKRSFAVELPPLAADPPSNGDSARQGAKSSEGVRTDPLTEVECSVSQDELVLSKLTVTSSVTEKACKTITAGPLYMVEESGSVDFEAPRILLRDGFAVQGSYSAISAVP